MNRTESGSYSGKEEKYEKNHFSSNGSTDGSSTYSLWRKQHCFNNGGNCTG